ncbi:MAG: RHS repeat domain-containing protein [Reichenbachiella sp.]|uniref:RHS repeat protein n=2 Tax=Reichenbachiella sp. TaxID=2184521 RepID=UPI003266BB19
MMKSIYSKYLLLSLIGVSSLCVDSVAQGGESSADFNPGEINIMPPSPTAGALGQYGLTPVSLSTGTPNISVPLHQISYRGINVPLSLSYSSNGLKVDEVASWVGQGWSLNAGGVITRVIKDEADEERGGRPIPEIIDIEDPQTLVFIDEAQGDGIDTELDLFMFNFNGNSGKFVIDEHRVPLIMPAQKLDISYTENSTVGFADYFIKTPDGIEYVFSDYEVSKTFNEGCGKDYQFFKTTAWYLSKIIHPNGAEVLFNYEPVVTNNYTSVDQTYQERGYQDFIDCLEGGGASTCGSVSKNSTCVRRSWVNGVKLNSIVYGNDSTVFTTSNRTDIIQGKKLDEIKTYVNGNLVKKWTLDHEVVTASLLPSGHGGTEVTKRLYLNGFKEWDQNSSESKDYVFEYIDKSNLPARLSFAQDHWGYYNGKNNSHLVPDVSGPRFTGIGGSREPDSNYAQKGMLSKITYPTGGFSEFDYEPNGYWTDSYIVDEFDSYELSHFSDEEVISTFARDTLLIDYQYEPDMLIFNAAVRPSHAGFGFVNCRATIKIYPLNDPDNAVAKREHTFIFDSLGQMEYKIFNQGPEDPFVLYPGAYAVEISSREFIEASIRFDYKSGEIKTAKNVELGGMRIKKETISDGIHTPQVKSYYYAPFEDLNSSSISIPQTPVYFKGVTTVAKAGGCPMFGECLNYFLYSNSQTNLFPISGSHIYYNKVLVADGENFANGFTEHDFIITRDANPKIILGDDITSATYSNIGWNNGLESKVTQRDASGKIIYLKENEWLIDSTYTRNQTGLVIQKKNEDYWNQEVVVTCDESNIDLCFARESCITQHSHFWHYKFSEGQYVCRASGHHNTIVGETCHPCKNKNVGDTVIQLKAIDHLNVVEYQNYSYRKFLGSTLETTINPDGTQIKKYSSYKYDDPDHMQLTAMESLTSREDTLKTYYYYPSDYGLAELKHLDTTMFMPALPVRVDQYRADQQTSSTIVKYDTLGQPLEVYKKIDHSQNDIQSSNVHIPASGYTKEVSLTYDSALHVVRGRSPRSGVGEAYVWNDEGTLVIGSAIHAQTDNFYYTSFEEYTNVSKIGSGSRLGSYFLSDHGFSPSDTTNLVMTYWYYENLEWKFSGELDFANKIHDVNYIDELRVYPKGAQVTTYFYDDYDRLTHVTDPKNRTTSYSYDDFGRLEFVKDNEGHVLSAQEYHYKNPISNQ